LALGVFLALAGGGEMMWRSLGHQPAVEGDTALWASQRQALEQTDTPLALIGASRLQYGFDMERWRELHPEWEPFMLAVMGKSPMSVLEDLARDQSFDGLAIVSLSEEMFEPHRWDDQAYYVDYYHYQYKIGAAIEGELETIAEKHLVSLGYSVNIERTVSALAEDGELQEPVFLRMLADRTRVADFSLLGDELGEYRRKKEEQFREGVEGTPLGPVDEWRQQIPKVRRLVDRIEKRGGKVVFVRMPVTGDYLAIAREFYPRDKYWDVFAAKVDAPTIHFEDVEVLAGLECPDSSHVDATDRATLTHALAAELERMGVLATR
jgi:nicotinamidase-related amidase